MSVPTWPPLELPHPKNRVWHPLAQPCAYVLALLCAKLPDIPGLKSSTEPDHNRLIEDTLLLIDNLYDSAFQAAIVDGARELLPHLERAAAAAAERDMRQLELLTTDAPGHTLDELRSAAENALRGK